MSTLFQQNKDFKQRKSLITRTITHSINNQSRVSSACLDWNSQKALSKSQSSIASSSSDCSTFQGQLDRQPRRKPLCCCLFFLLPALPSSSPRVLFFFYSTPSNWYWGEVHPAARRRRRRRLINDSGLININFIQRQQSAFFFSFYLKIPKPIEMFRFCVSL